MSKLVPIHEMARAIAGGPKKAKPGLVNKLLFTGNVLVKAQFQQTELPADADPLTIAMYCGPELTAIGRILTKAVMAFGSERTDHDLILMREIALNEAAQTGTQPVVVYGPEGPIAK